MLKRFNSAQIGRAVQRIHRDGAALQTALSTRREPQARGHPHRRVIARPHESREVVVVKLGKPPVQTCSSGLGRKPVPPVIRSKGPPQFHLIELLPETSDTWPRTVCLRQATESPRNQMNSPPSATSSSVARRAERAACRSSQRLRDGGGEQPEMVGRSSVCGWWRGQCPRASPIAHGDDRSAEAPWSLSPRGDHPPHATAHGPGWSPPSSRGFRAPTVRAAPYGKTVGRSPDRAPSLAAFQAR